MRGDVVSSPLADKRQAERSRAVEMVLKGQATPKGKNKVVKIAPGQYVELARQDEDSIFTEPIVVLPASLVALGTGLWILFANIT